MAIPECSLAYVELLEEDISHLQNLVFYLIAIIIAFAAYIVVSNLWWWVSKSLLQSEQKENMRSTIRNKWRCQCGFVDQLCTCVRVSLTEPPEDVSGTNKTNHHTTKPPEGQIKTIKQFRKGMYVYTKRELQMSDYA